MSALAWVAFLTAAGVGAPLRFVVDRSISARASSGFPWGTLAVNVSGSFVLGVLTGLALYAALSPTAKVVLGTGFCGAYTTFSTFSYETVRLVEQKRVGAAVGNALGMLVAALAAAAVGLWLASL